jgi:hypothetical protein
MQHALEPSRETGYLALGRGFSLLRSASRRGHQQPVQGPGAFAVLTVCGTGTFSVR